MNGNPLQRTLSKKLDFSKSSSVSQKMDIEAEIQRQTVVRKTDAKSLSTSSSSPSPFPSRPSGNNGKGQSNGVHSGVKGRSATGSADGFDRDTGSGSDDESTALVSFMPRKSQPTFPDAGFDGSAESILRKELLKRRFNVDVDKLLSQLTRVPSTGTTLDEKHYYVTNGNTSTFWSSALDNKGAEAGNFLNDTSQGSNYYNRIGLKIRNLRAHIKGRVMIRPITGGNWNVQSNNPPAVRFCIKFNKLPKTPNTLNSAWSTGSVTPLNSGTPMNALGFDITACDGVVNSVPDPVYGPLFHILRIWDVGDYFAPLTDQPISQGISAATPLASTYMPRIFHFAHNIDLGGLTSEYNTTSQSGPISNALEFTWIATPYANTVVDCRIAWTADVVFQDITTS